ncbi:MAG: HEAT repeat domain-containing protein [Armatimonadota bacterium]
MTAMPMSDRPSYDELLAENQRLKQKVAELERKLEEWKREFVIPMLIRKLLVPKYRDLAFKQLLSFGDEAVQILLDLLEDPQKVLLDSGVLYPLHEAHEDLRLVAIDRLVQLQAKEAVNALLKLLESENSRLRSRALWALGKLGELSDEVVPQIFELINDPDFRVKEEALSLLSDLGNAAAIPLLIPLLGDPQVVSGSRLGEHIAEALQRLGAGEIVSSFYRVVRDGDLSALEHLKPYRKPVIEALIRLLDSYFSEHIANSARALKEWNAIEALPKLRSKLRGAWLYLSDEARSACKEAVKHLEDLSRLPAPVSPTQIPIDTLPRPVDPTTFSAKNRPNLPEAPKEKEL